MRECSNNRYDSALRWATLMSVGLAAPLLIGATGKNAQPAAGRCTALQNQYSTNADMVARYMALGEAVAGQTSGAMQNTIETKQANALSRMKINMDMLKAAGCSLPNVELSQERYMPHAFGCRRALMLDRYAGDGTGSICDVATWRSVNP